MNKAILTGNLTRDPELSETAAGHTVAKFSIAVNRNYKRDGEYITDFFNCVTWNTTAEFVGKYCHKGEKILVEGGVENREWTDKDGVNRRVTEIQVQNVELLSPKKASEQKTDTRRPSERLQSFDEDDDGGIPF